MRSSKVNVRVAACRPEPTTSTPHSSSSSSSSSTNTTTVPCSLSARRDHPNEVVLPSRFTHVEASHALAAHADVRIVHFLSLRSGACPTAGSSPEGELAISKPAMLR
jgi:hypothetical protein